MSLEWFIRIATEYWPMFLRGAGMTLLVSIISTLIGSIIGLIIGVIRTIPMPERGWKRLILKALDAVLGFYIAFFRGTPMIVQAMVVYYGSMYVYNIDMSPMFAGLFVVSINTGAYMAETVRGGIISIDIGQTEAAKAIGMTHYQTMSCVVLPQALRNIMPQIGNNLIINIKDTSVLNVISVTELYFLSKSAAGAYYRYFEVFFITCVIYFVMTFTISRFLIWIEKKMDGPENYSLVEYDPLADPCGPFPPKGGYK